MPSERGNNRLNEPPRDPWLRRLWNNERGAGKGDSRRPLDRQQFEAGYDRVFNTCSDHPEYQAKRKPTADCVVCRRLWREAQLKGTDASTGNR